MIVSGKLLTKEDGGPDTTQEVQFLSGSPKVNHNLRNMTHAPHLISMKSTDYNNSWFEQLYSLVPTPKQEKREI